MFRVKFPEKEMCFEAPVSVYEAARAAELMTRAVLAAKVDGKVTELSAPLSSDCAV